MVTHHENVYVFHNLQEMFVVQVERMSVHPITGNLVKNVDPIRFGPDVTVTLESGQATTYTVIAGKISLPIYHSES